MRRSRRLRKAAEMNAPPKPTKKPMTVLNAASKENTDGNAEITSGKKILLTINPDLNKDVPMDVDSTVDFEQLLETISEDGDEDFFDVKTESLEELDVNLKELAHGQGYICTLCHVNIEE
ncbi:hypothetical protein Pmar_PMAR023975 [Perkinsus marinus ATCC 50983]|uniref:Uncharacterized protein n=1 Tax=Perkinsus marinus (strain ATCC 50983 / TXsc) TaxID=423536 RepID=C5L341_PERM5|nr:hypothetical protein Pmar_PMAR023975 [Perkinsus marinus ATCC 50983]EER08836.1 hypothetical protein Pmar_PMAR023975 [Perkinsus marinus ATCC 50983]|eukprot:XP_002777020.1 hypothetical protein Pmar_PMAR023975 [Perkinsus marinus ATCC 50983]